MKVYVSLDWECDHNFKYMLDAWNYGSRLEFVCEEHADAPVTLVKKSIERKMRMCLVVLVLVGRKTGDLHPRFRDIGYKNWQAYEIIKAREMGKKIIPVALEDRFLLPPELDNHARNKISFSHDEILGAINRKTASLGIGRF